MNKKRKAEGLEKLSLIFGIVGVVWGTIELVRGSGTLGYMGSIDALGVLLMITGLFSTLVFFYKRYILKS